MKKSHPGHLGEPAAEISDKDSPLFGLLLAGGHSRRMKTDKAALRYGGRIQTERMFELISPFCTRLILSNRKDQSALPGHTGFPQIHDEFGDLGPAGGILSALEMAPLVGWLVVACDLPFLDRTTIHHLVAARNPKKYATAYVSAQSGLPEPLCAIYEPKSRTAIRTFIERGIRCPRIMMIQSDVELLRPPNPRALEHIDTPEGFRSTSEALS